ncbi:mycothiol-dependent nitroreductase Rv2466c family protein [Qaidamihabitans albus]|uniref:mycothiol-dependent nitroreductase Rv2466c family protein n=1 Tax=Qaidamihabitans albus TaxID=2795733 RepID=UPI0018F1E8D0|nr:DsbA family protein [Qaidamihabitans albus]
MSTVELEFYFDPVCPFCWVTSQWVREVQRHRPVEVTWRPLSLRLLNEPIGYDHRPPGYPEAHQRGLEMLRVVDAARQADGDAVLGDLYAAMGEAVWHEPAPAEASFEAILASTGRGRDLGPILERAGLDRALADAAADDSRDEALRAETTGAVERAGGEVGTPILSFSPPDGPAFFGPVIDAAPAGDDALRLWDSIVTLAHWPGFAELKRGLRSFPVTPLSERLARQSTTVR